MAPDNREGVRISFDIDGELSSAWFLLRLSVHDPVMPLNAERDVPGGVKAVLGKLYDCLLYTSASMAHSRRVSSLSSLPK